MSAVCRRIVALVALLLCAAPLAAAEPSLAAATAPAKKTVRLLTIGNSFSQDATFFLAQLAEADGNKLILKTANIGGSPLVLHWEKSQLHERDPQDKNGLYGSGRGLKQILLDGPHDFVTIQQRSYISHDLATYRPYAANLQAYVKRYAPQAQLLLHQTWAYRVDDPQFTTATPKPGEPRSQQQMHQQLTHAYRTMAQELGVRLIPTGDAFHAADTDARWGFRPDAAFDRRTARPPALLDQSRSLHVGYKWVAKGESPATLSMDGHHASTAGRYLGACVWYEVLFAASCVGNSFQAGLNADYARFLQTTAHAAVEQSPANAAPNRQD